MDYHGLDIQIATTTTLAHPIGAVGYIYLSIIRIEIHRWNNHIICQIDCDGPVSQLALMIVNIIAVLNSIIVSVVVSQTLCCSTVPQTTSYILEDCPSIPVTRINAATRTTAVPDLAGRTTAVVNFIRTLVGPMY